ncbi:MAG: hypothetical protein WDN76_06895 [Alphaproteobacteria bacterium]
MGSAVVRNRAKRRLPGRRPRRRRPIRTGLQLRPYRPRLYGPKPPG